MTTLDATAKTSETSGGVDLETETVLPSQYFAGPRIGADIQPEKRLMLAVLEEAVGTYQNNASATKGPGRRLFADAEAWILSDATDWPFSFTNICSALGLEVSAVRSGLERWRQQYLSRVSAGESVVRVMFRRMNGPRHSTTGRSGKTALRDVA